MALATWPLRGATLLLAALLYRLVASPSRRPTLSAAAGIAMPAATRIPLFSPTEVDEVTPARPKQKTPKLSATACHARTSTIVGHNLERTPSLPAAQLVYQRKLVDCDCTRVTGGTDLSTDWRIVREDGELEAALAEVESLISLDALGALRRNSDAMGADRAAGRKRSISSGPVLPGTGRIENNMALHQMRLTNCYLREFLSKPHALLGRAGPTWYAQRRVIEGHSTSRVIVLE